MRRKGPPADIAQTYADREVTKAPPWGWLVVWDMWLNAMASGLFLAAAMAHLVRPAEYTALARAAYPIAFVLYLLDLICLMLDLGNPYRFHHMLRVFKPSSPMSLGTWFLNAFALSITGIVALQTFQWLGVLPNDAPWIATTQRVLAALGLPLAFGVAAYKGVLFSTTAQPGWRIARWLGAYHILSAMAVGLWTLLALAAWLEMERVRPLAVAACVVLLASVVAYGAIVVEMKSALRIRYPAAQRWTLHLVIAVIGGVIPACAAFLESTSVVIVCTLSTMVGALASRFLIVMLPHASRSKS
ncbi:MAG: polysulfide reductase NrfD [Gemmataceae bacterium]|nr:polysulfide reductase NrfD [Gemmataceae bacterium]